jgi:MFS family permease
MSSTRDEPVRLRSADGADERPSARAWKALFAAQIGWMLDSMDFLLFVFALRAIQAEFSLPSASMGLLTSVALVAGAAGGILFGRLADRIGRVRAMTLSMLVYSLATAGLATSGALWHFVFWRTLVGIGMGGEWSSGSVLVAETWPAKHRGKAIGLMQSGWAIGALLAAGLAALVLEPFGWRVLFVIGAFPAIVAVVIRRTVPEPEIWVERSAPGAAARPPFLTIFRPPLGRTTLVASLLAASVLVAFWGVMSWLPAFLATPLAEGGAGLTLTRSARWMIVVQIGAFFGYVSFGWLADRIGRRLAFTLFMIGATIAVPLYTQIATPLVLLLVGPLLGYFAHGYFSLFGAFLAELYPTAIRATAQGFCYNAGRLASALAPFAIGAAADRGGLAPALGITALFFLVAAGLIWLLPETKGAELTS